MIRRLKDKVDALLAAERGTVFKRGGADVTVALAYPNTYHVGMSNLGFQGIYTLLNERGDTVCERAFLPDEGDMKEYVRTGMGIVSMESGRPVAATLLLDLGHHPGPGPDQVGGGEALFGGQRPDLRGGAVNEHHADV